jgi:hypothetical protein
MEHWMAQGKGIEGQGTMSSWYSSTKHAKEVMYFSASPVSFLIRQQPSCYAPNP